MQAKSDLFNGKDKLNTAIFSQMDKKFGDRLNLSVGARYEIFQLESDMSLVIETTHSIKLVSASLSSTRS